MLKQMRWSWMAALVFLGLPLTGNAQAAEGGINGVGSAEVARPANCLRMQVEVTAEGKTIQEALAALKTRREAIKTQLVQTGAVADSVTFASPRLFADQSAQAQRMEQMMRQRMSGAKAAKAKEDEIVKVAATAKAEWMLKGTPDELLAQSFGLKKQVEQALKPATPAAGATTAAAAAEEAEEEGASQPGFSGYDNGEPKPGTPIFLYVSKVTAEERDKALTTAFTKNPSKNYFVNWPMCCSLSSTPRKEIGRWPRNGWLRSVVVLPVGRATMRIEKIIGNSTCC